MKNESDNIEFLDVKPKQKNKKLFILTIVVIIMTLAILYYNNVQENGLFSSESEIKIEYHPNTDDQEEIEEENEIKDLIKDEKEKNEIIDNAFTSTKNATSYEVNIHQESTSKIEEYTMVLIENTKLKEDKKNNLSHLKTVFNVNGVSDGFEYYYDSTYGYGYYEGKWTKYTIEYMMQNDAIYSNIDLNYIQDYIKNVEINMEYINEIYYIDFKISPENIVKVADITNIGEIDFDMQIELKDNFVYKVKFNDNDPDYNLEASYTYNKYNDDLNVVIPSEALNAN